MNVSKYSEKILLVVLGGSLYLRKSLLKRQTVQRILIYLAQEKGMLCGILITKSNANLVLEGQLSS
jgi:hypothetical protein